MSDATDQGAVEEPSEPTPSVALVPTPTIQKLDSSKRGGVHIGIVLEKARRRLHYSPEQISRELGVRPLELNQIEAGLKTPSPELVAQLADFYGIDPERLDATRRAEREDNMLYLGYAVVNLSTTDGSNGQVLQQIAATMRSIRDIHETSALTVRDDELAVISSVLDVEHPEFVADLARTFRLSTPEAAELAARLRHASLTRKELPAAE